MRREPAALAAALQSIAAKDLARSRRVVDALLEGADAGGAASDGVGARVRVSGRELVNFSGNDYLGLAREPRVTHALREAAARWGVGSGAAHLVTGHSHEHHALEEELAAFTGRARALLFSTGYMANLGVIATFAARGEVVLQDRLNHASLLDGAQLAGARLVRYAHACPEDASTRLATEPATLIATDGVFSMDGDVAPVARLAALARERHAWLFVDDAHGLGVLGKHGGGTLQQFGLDADDVPLLMGTLGKAFGTFGAFVAGDTDVIELLVQRARTYVYTTATPPALAAATRAALRIAREESWRREHLQWLVRRFRAGAAQLGLRLGTAPNDDDAHYAAHAQTSAALLTPILPILVGDAAAAVASSEALREAGFWVAAIRPPTVPAGSARLRVTLSAAHRELEVDALLDALAGSLRVAA